MGMRKRPRKRTLSEEVATAVCVSSEAVVCNDGADHGGSGEDGNLGEEHVD